MQDDSQHRGRRNRRRASIPDLPQRGFGPLVFWLVIVIIGLGLVAAAVAKAVPISRARILLERTAPHRVQGSLSFVFVGVPIFWRSLNGLHHLEKQDYTQNDFGTGTRRPRFLGEMTVSRVGFMDAQGRTLAWSEKASVLNARSRIEDFLGGSAPTFILNDEPLTSGLMSDSMTMSRTLFAFSLFAGGALFVGGGLRGMVRMLWRGADTTVDPETPSHSGPR